MAETHAPYPFKRITVRSRTAGGGTAVTWTFDPIFQDELPYTFTLQGARAAVGDSVGWADIGAGVVNAATLTDPIDRHLGDEQDYHYRIKLVNASGTYYSPNVAARNILEHRDWRFARDIIRKERLRHRYVGQRGWLLSRRREGTRCPLCLDTVGMSDDARCPRCFGTTYDGGYYAPQFAFFLLEPSKSKITTDQVEGTVQAEPQKGNCRMICDPMPASRDIFVDGLTDQRYWLEIVGQPAMVRAFPVVVTVDARPIGLNDIAYDIQVPDTLPDLDRDLLSPVVP